MYYAVCKRINALFENLMVTEDVKPEMLLIKMPYFIVFRFFKIEVMNIAE